MASDETKPPPPQEEVIDNYFSVELIESGHNEGDDPLKFFTLIFIAGVWVLAATTALTLWGTRATVGILLLCALPIGTPTLREIHLHRKEGS